MKRILQTFFLTLVLAAYARAEQRPDEGTVYVPIGKRDPFKRPSAGTDGRDLSAINPLEKFGIEQFLLRAILRGTSNAQAMFEDPEGRVHIVAEGTIIGRERGTISRILNREVIVTERTVNYLGVTSLFERVLSLPSDDEVDQSAPSKAGQGKTGGGGGGGAPGGSGSPGAGGAGGPTSGLPPSVIRQVSQERSAPAQAPAQAPPSAANNMPNISNYSTRSGSSPSAPSGGSGSIRGGSGNGISY